MIDDAALHRAVITIEDGLRAGGAGEAMRDAIEETAHGVVVCVMGIPTMYIAQGKPDAILGGSASTLPAIAARRERCSPADERSAAASAVERILSGRVIGGVDHLTYDRIASRSSS